MESNIRGQYNRHAAISESDQCTRILGSCQISNSLKLLHKLQTYPNPRPLLQLIWKTKLHPCTTSCLAFLTSILFVAVYTLATFSSSVHPLALTEALTSGAQNPTWTTTQDLYVLSVEYGILQPLSKPGFDFTARYAGVTRVKWLAQSHNSKPMIGFEPLILW